MEGGGGWPSVMVIIRFTTSPLLLIMLLLPVLMLIRSSTTSSKISSFVSSAIPSDGYLHSSHYFVEYLIGKGSRRFREDQIFGHLSSLSAELYKSFSPIVGTILFLFFLFG